MDTPNDPSVAPAAPDDPEIAALLHFAPVRRATRRSDGWPPDRQQGFVAALASLGNVDRAAHTVGRTASGAYKVRTSAGAEGFAEAWDKALALYHVRNPRPARIGRPSRGELLAVSAAQPVEDPPEDPDEKLRAQGEAFKTLVERYLLKLRAERTARLDGRIVEADYYVRQLTFIEMMLDLGEKGPEVLDRLRRRDLHPVQIVATPMSVLLDSVRRDYWNEMDEPERPPLGELGEHDGEVSTGERCVHYPPPGADLRQWSRHHDEKAALAAEAQAAWEEKARADAEAWAKREARR